MNVVFIVAAPRSGTTFIEEIFNQHPDVCGWHEPFFIWEYFIQQQSDDYLDETHATNRIKQFVREEFDYYLRKSKKTLVLEKTPSNAFKIRYMNHIFPDAKWIHLYRDGRDVISSMKKRYQHRKNLVTNRQITTFTGDVIYTLKRQPFWRHRCMAIWHELKKPNHLEPYKLRNTANWDQSIGWGPRYPGWRNDKKNFSEIEMMAMQWIKCEEYIQKNIETVKSENVFHLKYETLLRNPLTTLEKLSDFLGVSKQPVKRIASSVKTENTGKWQTGLTQNEIKLILPIVGDILRKYNYDISAH